MTCRFDLAHYGELLDAAAAVVLTESGRTARQVSRNRPRRPVIAASRNVHTCRRLALDWGTVPVLMRDVPAEDVTWGHSAAAAQVSGVVMPGERVVFTAGTISSRPGMTNMLKVEEFHASTLDEAMARRSHAAPVPNHVPPASPGGAPPRREPVS